MEEWFSTAFEPQASVLTGQGLVPAQEHPCRSAALSFGDPGDRCLW